MDLPAIEATSWRQMWNFQQFANQDPETVQGGASVFNEKYEDKQQVELGDVDPGDSEFTHVNDIAMDMLFNQVILFGEKEEWIRCPVTQDKQFMYTKTFSFDIGRKRLDSGRWKPVSKVAVLVIMNSYFEPALPEIADVRFD
jgi:hypothetical protein